MSKNAASLFVIGLPIGHRSDISQRALEILRQVKWIAAEDTRVTLQTLHELGLDPPALVSYQDHNEREIYPRLIQRLEAGEAGALVTDAGTPGIADPGYHLVRACCLAGISVIPIPGASSLAAALSISPIGGGDFYFGGFLPSNTSGRRKAMERVANWSVDRLVYFEAPHRLEAHLEDALDTLGNRALFLARELTKKHEEKVLTTVAGALELVRTQPPRGEYVLIYGPGSTQNLVESELDELIESLSKQGLKPSQIVKELQKVSSLSRQALYNRVIRLKQKN